MLDRSKVILRSLDTFGIAGQLSQEGEVFYTSLFSTKHLGRVSDLLCARLEKSGVDEFRLRFSVLLSVFEACYGLLSQEEAEKIRAGTSFSAPLSLECGIDEEKVAVGISFTLNPLTSLKADGLAERITKGVPQGKLEAVLKEIRNHSDLLFVKTDPVARKLEIVALIGLSTPSVGMNDLPALPEVLTLDSKTAKATPKPRFYSDLGDLNYPELLRGEGEAADEGHSGEILKPESSEGDTEKFDPGMTRVSGKQVGKKKAKASAEGKEVVGQEGAEQDEAAAEDDEQAGKSPSLGLGKKLGRFLGFGRKKKKKATGSEVQQDSELQKDSEDPEESTDNETQNDVENNEENESQRQPGSQKVGTDKTKVKTKAKGEEKKLVRGAPGEQPEKEKGTEPGAKEDDNAIVRGEDEESTEPRHVRGGSEDEQEGKLVKGRKPEKETETLVRGKPEQEEKTLVKGKRPEKEEVISVRGSREPKDAEKKVKAWSEKDGDTTRIRGKVDEYNDEKVRVSAEGEEEEEKPLRVSGSKPKKPSRWRVFSSEGEPDEEEDLADVEAKKSKKKSSIFKRAGRVIRNLIGSFGGGSEEEVEVLHTKTTDTKASVTPKAEPPVAHVAPSVAEGPGDPGTLEAEAKKLMNELHGGGLDHVLRVAQWEALAIKRDIKNPKASKWVDNLMGSLVQERSRLAEMGKRINISVRLKEMEFKDKLSLLQEEVRKREAVIAQRSAALARAKDQLTKVNESNEKLKVIAQNSEEDIHYKQKYDMTHKMLELAKEENAKILQRAEELKSQLNANVAANKVTPASASQLAVLQGKYEKLFKQSEEFKKANRQLMERLNEPRRAAAGAEEVRKKIEIAMKMVNIEKQEKNALKNHLVSSHQEQIKLREEIKRLQLENKHLLLTAQQPKKPTGGSTPPPQSSPPKAA